VKHYTAREYQDIITSHIIETPRCAVWAGMGLGKTVATYTALDTLFLVEDAAPALVIAPLRVAKNTWPAEQRKWSHLRNISVMPIMGDEATRRRALRYDANVFTTNYENIPWLVEHFGDSWPFKTVVPDEATRLKGFRLKQGTRRSHMLASVDSRITRMIELTGTPAPNGLQDLWGQMWFLDRGKRLGLSHKAFMRRWFQKSWDGYGSEPLPFAMEQIQDRIRDLCLTIDAKDWFDLDEPIINNVYVDLPPNARLRYRQMEDDMFATLECGTEIEVFHAAARTQKLLQFANGAVYLNPEVDNDGHPLAKQWREVHTAKLDALESIVQETNGARLLVAYEFKSDLARLRKAFPKAVVLDQSQETEDRWNAGKIPMLFAYPKSAGHGLNLQDGGHHLVYFGHNWDLELRMQIAERLGPVRQMQSGHDRNVWHHNIIARDTVDEDVIARTINKRTVQDVLLAAMKRRGKP
jgi:SNF2 family DNA or RNA helicase